jgi:hypothetical protein
MRHRLWNIIDINWVTTAQGIIVISKKKVICEKTLSGHWNQKEGHFREQ